MSKISFVEFNNDRIREQDGYWSVYDVIRVLGGKKNPRDVWNRLVEQYSDVVGKCDFIPFIQKSGRRGRKTPVANKQVLLEIIGLLPGQVGNKYREESAKLFLRYLEGDTTLATEIIERSTDSEAVRKHNQRTKLHENYLVTYHGVHDELKVHKCEGKHHAGYNSRINQAVGIPNGTRHEMTLDQKKEMMFRQLAGEYALKADQDSSKWSAVNLAVNAGTKALAPYKQPRN